MSSCCDDDIVGKVGKCRVGFAPCLRARYATDQFDVASAAPSVLNKVYYQLIRIFSYHAVKDLLARHDGHSGSSDFLARWNHQSKYFTCRVIIICYDKILVRYSKSCGKQASSVGQRSALRWKEHEEMDMQSPT